MTKIMSNQKVVIVLGMHRSGTSCLAGSLEERGLYLGNVKTKSPFNLKGNRENPDIFSFHEKIFNDYGGSWLKPPDTTIRLTRDIYDYFSNVIESYNDYHIWGFKDPRTVFTLNIWLQLLSYRQVFLVATFRNPLSVALSLLNRNQIPISEGLELWKRYNMRIIDMVMTHNVKLIDFDLSLDQYREKIDLISDYIGLKKAELNFYDIGLVKQKNNYTVSLPCDIIQCYEELKKLSLKSVTL
jgi:hypothetical protein